MATSCLGDVTLMGLDRFSETIVPVSELMDWQEVDEFVLFKHCGADTS